MKIAHWVVLFLITMGPPSKGAQQVALTPKELQAALASNPQGSEAERLAERIRDYLGKENIVKGVPKIDGLWVAWAIETPAPQGILEVASEDGKFNLKLTRVGTTN